MTIDRWIEAAAARTPGKTALTSGDVSLSYAAMAAEVDARARALAGAGIGRGDRVAWYGANHVEVFILLFACARLGAILVPLNWRLAEAEIAAIVEDCAPKLLIHDRDFAEPARALTGPRMLEVGEPIGPPAELADGGREDDPILIVYTSGSTGLPKGVVLSQAALACNAAMSSDAHRMTADDTVLNVLPMFHVGGLNILPTPAFSLGATVVIHPRFNSDAACAALQEVTLAILVPTVLQAIMATEGWATADLSRLRALSIGSTDVPVDLIEAVHARGVPMIQIYGATETAPLAIYQRIDEARTTVGSIGRVGSQCQARLVQHDGRDAPDGEPGEIWIKGANVLTEYWRNPEETGRALVDGWFRTGDVATRDPAGHYWFADRIKNVIISGGENIYPAELERVLRRHPAIAEVAVVGRPDPVWGETPVAVIVRRDALTEAEVMAELDGQVARYKYPRAVIFVDALPRNAMGKVVAANVRAMIGAS